MAFTIVGFSESQDAAGAFVKLKAIEDNHIQTAGDKITISELNNIVGTYCLGGTTGLQARLLSPSLRRTNPLYITPLEKTLVPTDDPAMIFNPESPIMLDTNEDLEVELKSDPAAAEQNTVGVVLSDGVIQPVTGKIFIVNCTITLALVAGEWAFSRIVFPDSLPVGNYSVVGARVEAAAGTLFRFVPVGGKWRPGGICCPDVDSNAPLHQRYGRMGTWFDFDTVQPPGVEVAASAAAASGAYQIYMDIIKI